MAKEKPGHKLAEQLKGLFAERTEEAPVRRFAAERTELPIPVRARVGPRESRQRRLRDVSVTGFKLDWPDSAERGQPVIVRFDGYPEVCGPFIVHGRVARIIEGDSPAVGVAIEPVTSPEALDQYRKLIQHYIEHRPLLDELDSGFFEGRCEECGWLGRVGERKPTCARCGAQVVPVSG